MGWIATVNNLILPGVSKGQSEWKIDLYFLFMWLETIDAYKCSMQIDMNWRT